MKKLLSSLMIATTLFSGVGATAAMAAPHHDNRPAQVRIAREADHVHRRVVRQAPHRWHRGERMSRAERSRYVVADWRRHNLRAPGRGYQWVRSDRNSGDYILVALASGLIASVIAAR